MHKYNEPGSGTFGTFGTVSPATPASPEFVVLAQLNGEALERTGTAITRLRSAIERLRGSWPEKDGNGQAPNPNAADNALATLRGQVGRAHDHAEMLMQLAGLLEEAV